MAIGIKEGVGFIIIIRAEIIGMKFRVVIIFKFYFENLRYKL